MDWDHGRDSIRESATWQKILWGADAKDIYQVEHDELFASIRKGEPINDGTWMAHSTLMAIMGRMAAYTGKNVGAPSVEAARVGGM
jgi:myo-inositol 2-dehydrogenase/D-chiro-inositol 1-dehydrogenase